MPQVLYLPGDYAVVSEETLRGYTVLTGVVTPRGAKVRRYGGDPRTYAVDGRLFDYAVFVTEQIPMSALVDVFGVVLRAEWEKTGRTAEAAVGLQVSVDGGTTYMAWTGAAWAAQGVGGTYNTRGVLVDNLATLTISNPRNLGFRVRLTTATDDTPVLRGLCAYVKWTYNFAEDLHETVADKLAALRVSAVSEHRLRAASSTVVLEAQHVPVGPFVAYNLTTDANRNTNIAGGYNAVTRTLTLTAQQAAGALIEVRYKTSAPVYVVRPDEEVEIAELPAIVAKLSESTNDGGPVGELYDYKIGDTAGAVRTYQHPVLCSNGLRVSLYTRASREAAAAPQVIRELLSDGWRLLSTGEAPQIIEETPRNFDDMPARSFFIGTWEGRVRFYAHAQQYMEHRAMRRLDIQMATRSVRWNADDTRVA